MARGGSGAALRLVLGLGAALLAALLSRLIVGRFWTFVPGNFPEAWPWGPAVNAENARLFEELMGLLVFGLLLVAFSQLVLVPWLRARRSRRS
jgi:hypothetical protein